MKAIVTGGDKGIGKGIVKALVKEGYDVCFTYRRDKEAAENLINELKESFSNKLICCQADWLNIESTKQRIVNMIELLGGIDLLVNNAATTGSYFDLFDMTDEYITNMMTVNYCSQVIAIRETGLYMAQNGIRGNIVNITSARGRFQCAFTEDAIYGAAKAGIERSTQSFALCLAPYGIRINNVSPGAIRSRTYEEAVKDGKDMVAYEYRENVTSKRIPLERLGEPEDIAQAVLFLASDKASYITGETIMVDGGLTLAGMPEKKRPVDAEDHGWGYVKKRDFVKGDRNGV